MMEYKSGTGQRELEYLIQNRIYSGQSSLNQNQQFKRKSKKSKAK